MLWPAPCCPGKGNDAPASLGPKRLGPAAGKLGGSCSGVEGSEGMPLSELVEVGGDRYCEKLPRRLNCPNAGCLTRRRLLWHSPASLLVGAAALLAWCCLIRLCALLICPGAVEGPWTLQKRTAPRLLCSAGRMPAPAASLLCWRRPLWGPVVGSADGPWLGALCSRKITVCETN